MEGQGFRLGYWILVPAVLIAAGILGYYTFRSSREHAELREQTIAQSLLSVAQQGVEEVERYVRAADNTVFRLVDPNNSSTIDTIWLPEAKSQTPSVRSVLLVDREGNIIQWASTDDRKTRRAFLRVFRQELLETLDLDSPDPHRLRHVHQQAGEEEEDYLFSYKAYSTLAGQLTYIIAHHDTQYLVDEVFPVMFASEESTPRYNIVDENDQREAFIRLDGYVSSLPTERRVVGMKFGQDSDNLPMVNPNLLRNEGGLAEARGNRTHQEEEMRVTQGARGQSFSDLRHPDCASSASVVPQFTHSLLTVPLVSADELGQATDPLRPSSPPAPRTS